MDEVPVVTSNPVKNVFAPPSAAAVHPQKQKGPGTFINFFLMMPFAGVILIQGFYLGKSIGDFTTFPFFTIQSYMTLGAILTMVVLVQTFMRSIVYSSLFAFVLLSGVFHSWFGEFWTPLIANFKEVLSILKTSWSKKDIPFPILMSSILTGLMVLNFGVNFIFSLFVKYFFEVVFGRDWSDGKRTAFVTTIIFLAIVQVGSSLYVKSSSNGQVILWSSRDLYKPLEEYCTKVPSGAIMAKDNLVLYDPFSFQAVTAKSGKEVKKIEAGSAVFSPTWATMDAPALVTRQGIIAYDKELVGQNWMCGFPIKLPIESLAGQLIDKEKGGESEFSKETLEELGTPLVVRTDVSKEIYLALFDYGFWAAISAKDGKVLWTRLVDAPMKVNRFSLDDFYRQPFVVVTTEISIFSCYNGRVTALKTATGEVAWEYMHKEAKHQGKGNRAFLTRSGERLLAAFPSGALVTLDIAKGTKVYEARNNGKWFPATPASWEGDEAAFISADGNYVRVQLDGGNVKWQQPLYENRPPLMPMPMNLEKGFAGYKDLFYQIATSSHVLNPILKFPKHVFAANPVVDGAYVYTGTQDGWVFCLHKDSFDEKWRVHLDGELAEDSMAVGEAGLFVRTRSGSIYSLFRGALQ